MKFDNILRGRGGRRCRTRMNPNEDEDLSKLLQKWDPAVEVPCDFRSSVWAQVAAREEKLRPSLVDTLGRFFSKPTYAGVAAAIALVFSLGLAHLNSEKVIAERRSEAATSYLASISPLARVSADGSTLSMEHGHE